MGSQVLLVNFSDLHAKAGTSQRTCVQARGKGQGPHGHTKGACRGPPRSSAAATGRGCRGPARLARQTAQPELAWAPCSTAHTKLAKLCQAISTASGAAKECRAKLTGGPTGALSALVLGEVLAKSAPPESRSRAAEDGDSDRRRGLWRARLGASRCKSGDGDACLARRGLALCSLRVTAPAMAGPLLRRERGLLERGLLEVARGGCTRTRRGAGAPSSPCTSTERGMGEPSSPRRQELDTSSFPAASKSCCRICRWSWLELASACCCSTTSRRSRRLFTSMSPTRS